MTPLWKSCADGSPAGSFPAAEEQAEAGTIITADSPRHRPPTMSAADAGAAAQVIVATAAARAGEAGSSPPAICACSSFR